MAIRILWMTLILLIGATSSCTCASMQNPDMDATMSDVSQDNQNDTTTQDINTQETSPLCVGVNCMLGERCTVSNGMPSCVPAQCSDLNCTQDQVCTPAPSGRGNYCRSVVCSGNDGCLPAEYCNPSGRCVMDVCAVGSSRCNGSDTVEVCNPDGSGYQSRLTCQQSAGFPSRCVEANGQASCSCEGDWDCPQFTRCEAGSCTGTGTAPTCRLPPEPFTNVLPSAEPGFPWGGQGPGATQAMNSPFPDSSQVVMTPAVINLDDDNGDGAINELDIPEIVFLSFCNSDYQNNGVLRAVHGGGPNRGRDFFATCGNTVWHEGDPLNVQCTCDAADLDSTASLAAGDLDNDGVPEIVAVGENNSVRIYSNRGVSVATSPALTISGQNPAIAIANIDNTGLAEIIIGRNVLTLTRNTNGTLGFLDRFEGTQAMGTNNQGPIPCIANVAGGAEQEIIAGSSVYRLPTPPNGVTRRSECAMGNTTAFCRGELDLVWHGPTVNGAASIAEGFCAVADVLGANTTMPPGPNNPLDQTPEVVVVANGRLQIYAGSSGMLLRNIPLGDDRGGAPNIDDFDGDGFPEIGTAFSTSFIMVDLQPPTTACPAWPNIFNDTMMGMQGNPARNPPGSTCSSDADCGDLTQFSCNEELGRCVCLHNGWMRGTEDDSSRVTGSTVFDFNGDGAAEIVYNDECYFRIYDGQNGRVLFKEPSESRTRTENPVIADTDNDGNAEIVFSTSNESGFCSDRSLAPRFNNGIEVWGDQRDLWVSARRVWNQHSYHVTNVLEGGRLPQREPENWRPYQGRLYNTYRSQPRSFGTAPNLVVTNVQVSSPDAMCGTLSQRLVITATVANQGDVRVGPDVQVGFYGVWTTPARDERLFSDMMMTALTARLGATLEPGNSILVSVMYDARNNQPQQLPDQVRVVVDDTMAERECIETDNTAMTPVQAGSPTADLTVELGSVTGNCPSLLFPTTVRNQGSVVANGVVVRYYLGDPSAGGQMLHQEILPNPLMPGETVMISPRIQYPTVSAIVYVVVDPDNQVQECNDANNSDSSTDRVECAPG